MRRMIGFECKGDTLFGTLDEGHDATGLIIVSGSNEIRSGAYAGQTAMGASFAAKGTPVFRYDRRGIGDSEGINNGFESSADDIAAAIAAFREAAPHVTRIVAFGNCDAASALALFHETARIDALILANPWVIETAPTIQDTPTKPNAAAIRARYWARIKNPRSLIDLFTGKINLKKLIGGIASASRKDEVTGLVQHISNALAITSLPVTLLIARRDTTAMAFMSAWHNDVFKPVRERTNILMQFCDTASHSFAGAADQAWLAEQITACLDV